MEQNGILWRGRLPVSGVARHTPYGGGLAEKDGASWKWGVSIEEPGGRRWENEKNRLDEEPSPGGVLHDYGYRACRCFSDLNIAAVQCGIYAFTVSRSG